MTGLTVTDGYGLAALFILAAVVVIALAFGYMIIRGETRIHRTRLGVFVERDKFPDDQGPAGAEQDTVELDPGDY